MWLLWSLICSFQYTFIPFVLFRFISFRFVSKNKGCFSLCQRFRKFLSEFKWNWKVRFGFLWPEYSGSPLEVVHTFRSEYSDRNSPFHIWQTGSLPLLGNSATKFKMTTVISIGWPDLIGKCRSIFLKYSCCSLTGQFGIMESTLKFKVQPTNAFFATVNQMLAGSSQLSTAAERAAIKSLCTVHTTNRVRQ